MSHSGHDRGAKTLRPPPEHLVRRYFGSKGQPLPHDLPDRAEPEQGLIFNPAEPALAWEQLMGCEDPDPGHAAGNELLRQGPAWEGTDERLTILSCGLGQDSTALATAAQALPHKAPIPELVSRMDDAGFDVSHIFGPDKPKDYAFPWDHIQPWMDRDRLWQFAKRLRKAGALSV